MKYILTLCCLFLCNIFCYTRNYGLSQDSIVTDSIKPMAVGANTDWITPSMPQIIYPTPSAMEMYKYLGHPISYATGLIDISVPLYTMKNSNLDIPLQLKYHSSGIKIQDAEGVLGLGWSMFPGFKISRIIMGKPDDVYPVVSNDFDNMFSSDSNSAAMEMSNFATFITQFGGQDGKSPGQIRKDGLHDIFSIYLPNENTSFILEYVDGKYNPLMLPEKSPLRIVPIFDNNGNSSYKLYAFDVWDAQGNKYSFGPSTGWISGDSPDYMEITPSSAGTLISGWLLREITQPNGEKIFFSYIESREEDKFWSSSFSLIDDENPNFHVFTSIPNNGEYSANNFFYGARRPLQIASIESERCLVNFCYSHVSMDIHSISMKLESIIVRDKTTGRIVKNIRFTSGDNYFLKDIDISGEGKYQFEYNMFEGQFGSRAIDWFGYFNGRLEDEKQPYNIPACVLKYVEPLSSHPLPVIGVSREVGPDAMKAKSLKKITYPTGGWLAIDYESHQFRAIGYGLFTGGGLRVKSTQLHDPVSDKTVTKHYNYVVPGDNYMCDPTNIDLFMQTVQLCGYYINDPALPIVHTVTARQRTISAFSPYGCFSMPIWYKEVTESSDGGKQVYTYYNIDDYYFNFYGSYIPASLNRFAFSPILMNHDSYDNAGKKKKSIKYSYILEGYYDMREYAVIPLKALVHIPNYRMQGGVLTEIEDGISSFQNWSLVKENIYSNNLPYRDFVKPESPIFGCMHYGLRMYSPDLDSICTTTYFDSDSIIEKIAYEYDEPSRIYNISKKSILTDDGEWLHERYYYTDNAIPDKNALTSEQQNIIRQMDDDNYKTTVIQRVREKGDKRLYSKLTGFKKAGEKYLPETEYFQKGNHSFEERIKYHLYDNYGNPVQISMDDNAPIFYIWGYKGQYPVAEIRNVDSYNTLRCALHGRAPEGMSADTTPDYVKIEGLRTNRSMKDAQITTFRYDPSVGITQETDPRGVSTYYTYDSKGRLIEVYFYEDGIKKILENYQYNIINQ